MSPMEIKWRRTPLTSLESSLLLRASTRDWHRTQRSSSPNRANFGDILSCKRLPRVEQNKMRRVVWLFFKRSVLHFIDAREAHLLLETTLQQQCSLYDAHTVT